MNGPARPVSVRLTDEERATLTARAGDERLSVYIRRAALSFGDKPVRRAPAQRNAFIKQRMTELTEERFHPERVRDMAEAEWDEIQREEARSGDLSGS